MERLNEPMMVKINDTWYPIIDISPQELTIQNCRIPEGDWCFADILIPSRKMRISAVIEIMGIDISRRTKARFKSIHTKNKALFLNTTKSSRTAMTG